MNEKEFISCRIATELMSKSFERKLSAQEKIKLKAHLAVCATCIRCFRQMRSMHKFFKEYTSQITNAEYSEIKLPLRHKQKIEKSLRSAYLA
jgi:predicted anti-sigma-YlaC factor YlaD